MQINPLRSAQALPAAVAKAIGLFFQTTLEPMAQLLNYLQSKKILLILDGYESLLETAGFTAELLHAAPGCKILVTSRARLNVKGENLFPLKGLEVPPVDVSPLDNADQAVQYSSVQLFLEASQRLNPALELRQVSMAAVAEICRLTCGMPLGLLLASTWMGIFTPGEIASEIQAGLGFLSAGWEDTPLRQRSLKASFDYSWGYLAEKEQLVLAGLSTFPAGFTRQAAFEVVRADPHTLLSLADKSLVQRGLDGRYQLHDLVCQFAAEKLRQNSELEALVYTRNAAFYAQELQRWDADLKSARQGTALLEMDAEHENWRAVWDWAVKQRKTDMLEVMLDGLGRYYLYRKRLGEGETTCQEALDDLKSHPESPELLKLCARLYGWQSKFVGATKFSSLALSLIEKGLSLLKKPCLADQDIRREKAILLLYRGAFVDNWDAGYQDKQASLALYRSLGDRWAIGQALMACASYIPPHIEKYHEITVQCAKEGLAIFQELEDPRAIAECLDLLAWEYISRGEVEHGEGLIREAILQRRSIDNRYGELYAHERLATVFLWAGKYTESHQRAILAKQAYHELGDRRGEAFVGILLNWTEIMEGEYALARQTIDEYLEMFNEVNTLPYSPEILLSLGCIALGQGAYAEAEKWFLECENTWHKILKDSAQESLGLKAFQAYAALAQGRMQQAMALIRRSLQVGIEEITFWPVCLALSDYALVLARWGQRERAIEMYTLATQAPAIANSHLVEDLVGREVQSAAASLEPEVVYAAQARGRARDLFATAEELLDEIDNLLLENTE